MKKSFKQRCYISALIALIFLLGCFIATQFTAIKFGFNPILGKPWIACLHFYNPMGFWQWVYSLEEVPGYSNYFNAGWLCIGSSLLIIFGLVGWFKGSGYLKKDRANTYGSAHFATLEEVNKSGLLSCDSEPAVYVGAYKNLKTSKIHYLKDNSTTHVFVFAPSRSGKGVGLIIPTLLSYSSSVIISDFKLENWYLTSGYRQQNGHKVLKFDPTCTDQSGAKFNPLFEIRLGQHEIRDTQLIADMLVDPEGKGINDHWSNAANSLLVSIILHVLYSESDKSLAGVRAFLANPDRTEEETLQLMLESDNTFVSSGGREMLNKSEGERSSIISSALTFLKLYRDPIVAENTRGHDFSINDLVFHEKPVSLYLGIPPSDVGRLMPLMRLILQMILSRLTEKLEMNIDVERRRQLLLLLDEFPLFGRLPFFEKTLGYSSGYNIRAYLISQDIQQIYKEYGREQSITSNCGIRIAYAPNTLETAKHLSEVIGSTTLRQKQFNYSGKRLDWFLHNVGISEHDIKRPLMTPDELMQLPQDVALIFKNGVAPIYGKKIYYYNDSIFKKRANILVPQYSDKIIP